MAVRSVLLPRTTLTFIAASGLALSGAVALGTGWAASATPTDPHKVWVCKYVQKPHQNEELKAGKNPIYVDWAALTGKASAPHVGDTFSDAQDKSLVVKIGGSDPGRVACPGGTPPTTTKHTPPPTTTKHTPPPTTTTHTIPPTMTTTVPPTMTTTVPPTMTTTVPPTMTTTVPGTMSGTVPATTTSTTAGGGVGAGGGDNGGIVDNGGFVDNGGNGRNGGAPGPVPGFGAPDTGGDGDGTPIGLLVGPGLLAAGIAVAVAEAGRRRKQNARG